MKTDNNNAFLQSIFHIKRKLITIMFIAGKKKGAQEGGGGGERGEIIFKIF